MIQTIWCWLDVCDHYLGELVGKLLYSEEETDTNQCKLCVCINTDIGNRKGRAELCSVFPVKQEVSRVRPQKHCELLL